jgi:hypothetical protein
MMLAEMLRRLTIRSYAPRSVLACSVGAPASRNFNSGDINPGRMIGRRANLSPNAKNFRVFVTKC